MSNSWCHFLRGDITREEAWNTKSFREKPVNRKFRINRVLIGSIVHKNYQNQNVPYFLKKNICLTKVQSSHFEVLALKNFLNCNFSKKMNPSINLNIMNSLDFWIYAIFVGISWLKDFEIELIYANSSKNKNDVPSR